MTKEKTMPAGDAGDAKSDGGGAQDGSGGQTREQELQAEFAAGRSGMSVDEFLDHVRANGDDVPAQARELVSRLDAAEAALETANEEIATLTAKVEAAEKAAAKAKAKPKVSAGDKAPKARTFPAPDPKKDGEAQPDLRALIGEAETVEVVFCAGRKEVQGIPPIAISGDAWKDSPNGLMLTEPVTLHGPAHGQAGYSIEGFGLLIDGKPVAYRARLGGKVQVGPGGTIELRDDIIL